MSDERVSELTYTNQNEGGLPAELIPSFHEKNCVTFDGATTQNPKPLSPPHPTPLFHLYFFLTVLRHKREKSHAYINLADVLSIDIWLLHITTFQFWCK